MKNIIKYTSGVLFFLIVGVFFSGHSSALSGSEFNAGRIIDDAVFFNSNSMSVGEIQNFLNGKVTCDTNGAKMTGGMTRAQYAASRGVPTTFTCLPQYRENINNHQNNIGNPSYSPPGSMSAAEIIYKVSADHGVSSKALIVLLQKEQALITDEWPFPRQYQIATGYGCPDTAPCDDQYYGFYNQVNKAAYQFKRYVNNSSAYRYKAGQVNSVLWSPTTSCGASNVFIENGATAALYNYTPYRPNAAALNNLYGSGDGCSSYGNRNFWRYFRDWFGVANGKDTSTPHPDGSVIAMDGKVYLVDSQILHHVASPKIFESWNFKWSSVVDATIGDRSLPIGYKLDFMWIGTLYQIDTISGVFFTTYEDGQWMRKHISYASFVGLGYSASDVVQVSSSEVPAMVSSEIMVSQVHPNGTLINSGGRIYYLDSGTKRYVSYVAFVSHGFSWGDVKSSVPGDESLPPGHRMLLKEGTSLLVNGGVYFVDLDNSGEERGIHIGPWECYSNKLGYSPINFVKVDSFNFVDLRSMTCR